MSARKPRPASKINKATNNPRSAILSAVLMQAPFDGWSAAAYEAGLKQAGIGVGQADLLFPQAIRDVIDYFGATVDDAMEKQIAACAGFSRMRVRDKIIFALRARLEALTPHREAVRRMLFWYALPTHLHLGARRLYRTVDLIWRAAGDESTDFNFYTKRGLLAGVVKATTVFWLDDSSDNCEASWAFLDRRISEVLKLGKSISLAKEWSPAEWLDIIGKRLNQV